MACYKCTGSKLKLIGSGAYDSTDGLLYANQSADAGQDGCAYAGDLTLYVNSGCETVSTAWGCETEPCGTTYGKTNGSGIPSCWSSSSCTGAPELSGSTFLWIGGAFLVAYFIRFLLKRNRRYSLGRTS